MSFPNNPVNGQKANVNGVTYTYSSTLSAWTVTSSFLESFTGNLLVANNVNTANTVNTSTVSTGAVLASGNITGGNIATAGLLSATGNITGGNITTAGIVGAGTVRATNGWSGTNSSAGVLGGIVQSFACERNAAGAVNGVMAFGNGSTASKGLRMPFDGKLVAATLAGYNVNGTIAVDAFLNGVANSSYRLTATGSLTDIGDTQNFQSSPLSFAAGSTLGWIQQTVPTSAAAYTVTFYVIFD
jgi:hypothetical protein